MIKLMKLVKRHRVTFHLKSGNSLTFDAKEYEVNYDNQGVTSYSYEYALNPPVYVYPRQIEAVTARLVRVWRPWK